ncbi:hypothetical protein Tco_0488436 [Tanacetum coccineum]
MSSQVSNKYVHLGEHRKQKPFLKFNDLQCPTCKKYLYSANHDECVLEYLSRLNPRASAQNKDAKSYKTTKRYMPQRRLIAADQASVFIAMMSVHISSGLVLHQITSDHNRSELGIQDHSNEQSSSKLVPKVVLKHNAEDNRYQANPKESHLVAVKRIFRYLKGTPNLGLWYPKGSGFDLKAYSDSDYAGCNLDRKSTSRGCQILGGKLGAHYRSDPSAMVMWNTRGLWYTTEVKEETKTITFLLSWWDKPLSFTQDKFVSAIGLPICKDAVPLPPKETVRAGLANLVLFDKDKCSILEIITQSRISV